MSGIEVRWRAPIDNAELNVLHAESFEHRLLDDDWAGQLERWSLGWVTARDDVGLVGFVNVAWDGGVHAFVLDTAVAGRARRRGHATSMVRLAADQARSAGCEWLHVDFEEHLCDFYLTACGFRSTHAGLIALH